MVGEHPGVDPFGPFLEGDGAGPEDPNDPVSAFLEGTPNADEAETPSDDEN